jgi:hypothetical protein
MAAVSLASSRASRDSRKKEQQKRGRPENDCHSFGRCRRHANPTEADKYCQRSIDKPRPVHSSPPAQPVLSEIKPALAGKKILHLDEPHGVIG